MKPIRVLAHAGGHTLHPENTLEAMAAAAQAGADGIECDVQLTSDGEIVAFHDDSLERMTGAPERVERTSLNELRSLRIQNRYKIPRMEEVLEFIEGYPRLEAYLDLHNPSYRLASEVARAIEKKALQDKCLILGFYSESRHYLMRAKSERPSIRISLMPEYPWGLLKKAREVGADDIAVGWDRRLYTKYLFLAASRLADLHSEIRKARDAGVRVSGGVANSPRDILWLLRAGVDGIWTDDPAMAQEVLGNPASLNNERRDDENS